MAEFGKKLGKLSLAILENFVEGVLGEKFVAELYEPTGRALAIIGALEETEKLFVDKYNDKDLSKALFVDLKQSDRPTLGEAVGKYFDHPTDPSLRQSLQEILFDEFKNILSKERIDQAVDFYIKLLTKELMLKDDVFRDNIAALAIVDAQLLGQRQVELLEKIADNVVNQQVVAQQIFRSLHQLPPPPADFTGREQLITDLLKDFESHKGATISGLTGMGGIGKTALGLAVASQLKEKYPDAQIFLDLKGTSLTPLTATDVMRHVILSFEPSKGTIELNSDELIATYYSVLFEKKILLFFDNARSADQIAPLTPSDTCGILVTSRWTFSVPGLKISRLDVMNERESIDLLINLCPRIGSDAAELAHVCGYLPLALRISGSFLNINSNWTTESYLSKLLDNKERLTILQALSKEAELFNESDVSSTFDLSYKHLADDEKIKWRSLGVFRETFTVDAVAFVWNIDITLSQKMLGFFCRFGLLSYDPVKSRYCMHDLLSDYAIKQLVLNEETIPWCRHGTYFANLLCKLVEENKPYYSPDKYYDDWQNILSGQLWLANHLDTVSAVSANQYAVCIFEYLGVTELLPVLDRIRWLESGLLASRLLNDKKSEAHHLFQLGKEKFSSEDPEQSMHFDQAVTTLRAIGDIRLETALLEKIATYYLVYGDKTRVIDFYNQSLLAARKLKDRELEGMTLYRLGFACYFFEENQAAKHYWEESLQILSEIKSPFVETVIEGLADLGRAGEGESKR